MNQSRKTRKNMLSQELHALFQSHAEDLRQSHNARKEAVTLKSVATDTSTRTGTMDITETLGVRMPGDRWQGCVNLRTLRTLLSMVDDRGFERCANSRVPPAMLEYIVLISIVSCIAALHCTSLHLMAAARFPAQVSTPAKVPRRI